MLLDSTRIDSTLKKKSQINAYHFIRECVGRDERRSTYFNTHGNISDFLKKLLPTGEKHHQFFCMILHHIFGTVEYARLIELLVYIKEE